MDVARLLATGASNAEIARDLVISPHTVKVHLRNIFEKLQVNSRTEATMALVQNGWLEVAGAVRIDGTEMVETTPAPREPEPLADLPATPAPWQRVWLAVALVATLFLLVTPWFAQQTATSAPLLSDVDASDGNIAPVALDARWEGLAPMPQARSRHAVARWRDTIYSFGGEGNGGELLDSVTAFDLEVNRWRAYRSLPESASNLAAATLGDAIYIAGGTIAADTAGKRTRSDTADGQDSSESDAPLFSQKLWRFDPVENAWREMGTLPVAVAGAALLPAKFNGEDALILAGGWDGTSVRDEVWLLPLSQTVVSQTLSSTPSAPAVTVMTQISSATTDESISAFDSPLLSPRSDARWQLQTRLPVARAFMGATMVGDDLYAVGGFDGKQELVDADRYNLVNGRWESLAPLQTGRSGLALVYDDVALHALGGGWLQNVDTNERFDAVTGTWASVPSPVAGSWRHLGAVSANGGLYLMGGWNGDYMDLAISYQSTFRSLLPVITNP